MLCEVLFVGVSFATMVFTIQEFKNRFDNKRKEKRVSEILTATTQVHQIVESLNFPSKEMGDLFREGRISLSQLKEFYQAILEAEKSIAGMKAVYLGSIDSVVEGTGLSMVKPQQQQRPNNNNNNNQQQKQGN